MIFEKKARQKEGLSKGIADTTALAEVTQVSVPINLAWKYMWAISKADLDAAKTGTNWY